MTATATCVETALQDLNDTINQLNGRASNWISTEPDSSSYKDIVASLNTENDAPVGDFQSKSENSSIKTVSFRVSFDQDMIRVSEDLPSVRRPKDTIRILANGRGPTTLDPLVAACVVAKSFAHILKNAQPGDLSDKASDKMAELSNRLHALVRNDYKAELNASAPAVSQG